MVKVVAIIQARLSSSRLPAKVMLDLMGKTVLERVVDRVRLAESVDEIWIATSSNKEDDVVAELAKRININCYRGSLENVISRYYESAKLTKADIIIRVTADNPLTEPAYIDEAVQSILEKQFNYVTFSNVAIGSGVEAFSFISFKEIVEKSVLSEHNIEHVTSYYYQNNHLFDIGIIEPDTNPSLSITVDTLEDYVKVFNLYEELIKKNIDQRNYLKEIISWE